MARRKKSEMRRQIEAMAAASGITVGDPSAHRPGPNVLRAKYPGWCDGCNDQIGVDDPIVIRHDRWICRRCAPGGDDK